MGARIFFCCIIIVIADAIPISEKAIDIEKTIAHVEDLLQNNPSLPRLTRSEILELLDEVRSQNITQTSTHSIDNPPEISNEIEDIDNNNLSNDLNYDSSNISATVADSPVTEKIQSKNTVTDRSHTRVPITDHAQSQVPVTEKSNDKLYVVLPYTSADGGLDELFTRPPRVALLRSPSPMQTTTTEIPRKPTRVVVTKRRRKPGNSTQNKALEHQVVKKPQQTRNYYKTASPIRSRVNQTAEKSPNEYKDFSTEIQAFLDNHELFGSKVGDSYITAGFKPLPTESVINGQKKPTEKILLWQGRDRKQKQSEVNTFLDLDGFDPQLDLEALASEMETSVLALNDSATSSNTQNLNYEPIDYDTIKVLPLRSGQNPIDSVEENDDINVLKRQSDITTTESLTTDLLETTTITDNTSTSLVETTVSSNETPKEKNDASLTPEESKPSLEDLENSFGGPVPPTVPARKNGFYFMLDWNSFLEVGSNDDPKYVNIRLEPKIGDPQMFLPVSVP